MKKIILILICLISVFCSCNKIDTNIPKEVNVSFSYIMEQGSMYTKSNVFSDVFYTQIVSKDLVAEHYSIKLVETTTGETYSLQGNWKSNDMFTLKTGKYKVTGKSTGYGDYIQSKCSLKFDTEIEIKSSDNIITIPAQYDCFLLIFNKDNVRSVECYYDSSKENDNAYSSSESAGQFNVLDKYLYAFSNKLYRDNAKNPVLLIKLNMTYKDGNYDTNNRSWFYTKTINFEIGKYYLYNPIDNNFSIPEMTQGNI